MYDGILLDGKLAEYEAAFRAADSTGNGSIGATEVARLFEGLGQPLSFGELTDIFKKYDKDSSGQIELNECAACWQGGVRLVASLSVQQITRIVSCQFVSFMAFSVFLVLLHWLLFCLKGQVQALYSNGPPRPLSLPHSHQNSPSSCPRRFLQMFRDKLVDLEAVRRYVTQVGTPDQHCRSMRLALMLCAVSPRTAPSPAFAAAALLTMPCSPPDPAALPATVMQAAASAPADASASGRLVDLLSGDVTVILSDRELDEALALAARDGKRALLFCSLSWCRPCMAMQRTFQKLAAHYPGVAFLKLMGDANGSTKELFKDRLKVRRPRLCHTACTTMVWLVLVGGGTAARDGDLLQCWLSTRFHVTCLQLHHLVSMPIALLPAANAPRAAPCPAQVRSTPSFFLFDDGTVSASMTGAKRDKLEALLRSNIPQAQLPAEFLYPETEAVLHYAAANAQ